MSATESHSIGTNQKLHRVHAPKHGSEIATRTYLVGWRLRSPLLELDIDVGLLAQLFDPQGGLLVCDIGNHRVRRIDLKAGTVDTWAGNGDRKPTPDGAPLDGVPLNGPRAIDLDPQGNLYLVLREGNAVYRIDAKTRRIHHLAGTGEKGYTGDGGDARQAKLSGPKGIAWSPDGGVYIADTESHTIRRIDLKNGVISTAAGTGERGDGPDGDPLKCKMARPHGVFVDKRGVVYVGDSESHRVRVLR